MENTEVNNNDEADAEEHDESANLIGDRLQMLVNQSVYVCSLIRDELVELTRAHHAEYPRLTDTTVDLFRFASERGTGLITLLQLGYIWDATILMRCISEATCKIMFLCYADTSERERRLVEFWDGLADARKLRTSERFTNYLGMKPERDSDPNAIWQELQILTEEEEAAIRSRSSRRERKTLEQKWSFFEMAKSIDAFLSSKDLAPVSAALVLAYGRSSSIVHADEFAMLTLYDYRHREDDEKSKLWASHIVENLSSYMTMALLSMMALRHVYDVHPNCPEEIASLVYSLMDSFSEVNKEFFTTQEAFADRFRTGELKKEEMRI